eukprot:5552526-Ditylum_brightwellii.AAC.1
MTAHAAYAGMPKLIDHSSSDKAQDFSHFSESESDADSNYTNYNSKMPAQLARNENKNLLGIGNGGSNLDGDDDDRSFLIQDAIEHSMAQFS